MSKKNKKQQPNGFLLFMRDMQQDMRERGRHVALRDMTILAGPKWAKLSDQEKAAYNARAKAERRGAGANPRGAGLMYVLPPTGRMDCTGELLSDRRDTVAERDERRKKEREIIRASLSQGSTVIVTPFYFIDIQSLCEISGKEEARYQPCEIAVVEYSLHSGIARSYHRFIDPGPLPLGYRYQAQSHSDLTHEIPVQGFERAEKNYRQLLWEVESFVSPDGSRDIPAVFSKREDAERVEWCLKWLAAKAGVRNRLDRVYEVETLLCELSSHKDGRGPTYYQAVEYFSTNVYDYCVGTRCQWHEERENRYCSLGVVNKYAYILSDTLCPKYSIGLTPTHLPPVSGPQVAYESHTPSTRSSIQPTPSPLTPLTPSPHSAMKGIPDISQQMNGLSLGRGRGRGRGFVYREPRNVGMLQQD